VGLAIASGFPGATAGNLTTCNARVPDSVPASFGTQDYATYALTPGGPFAFAGKVAVLTDGLNYSAADYFAYVTRHATSAILVGSTTAGAFGASSANFTVDSASPALSFTYDINRCVSLPDRSPLETKGTEPSLVVEYAPADLVAGKDTVLETAIAQLKQ
jgi:C-terminal processing protease CtpA/Prc